MPAWLLSKPVLYLIAVAALAAGLIYLHHRVYQQGYDAADQKVRAEYVLRDKSAQDAATARIAALTKAKEATEASHAAEIHVISTKLQQDKQNADTQIASLRRDVAAGKRVFRDPGRPATGSSNPVCSPTASAGGSSGAPGTDIPATDQRVLSSEATEFLIAIGAECDAVARQVNSAADVIRSDRK